MQIISGRAILRMRNAELLPMGICMLHMSQVTIVLEEKPIIENLSLTIEPGSIHALMGPNGSGKSTLALTLMGHPRYEIAAGSIMINGEDVNALPVEKRARLGLFLSEPASSGDSWGASHYFLKRIASYAHGERLFSCRFQAVSHAGVRCGQA